MILELSTAWSSAHLYSQPLWSHDQNQAVFGKCFSDHGHGHDYRLEIGFEIEKPSDIEIQEPLLKAALQRLHEKLDHHHLNFTIAEFKTQVPTTENLAVYCWKEIQGLSRDLQLPHPKSLRLYEKPDLWVEITA